MLQDDGGHRLEDNITGLSRAELYSLNPGHRGDRIDTQSPMRILIPADLSPTVDARLKKLQGGGGLWASNSSNTPSFSSSGVTITPSKSEPPALTTSTTTRTTTGKPADRKSTRLNPVTRS